MTERAKVRDLVRGLGRFAGVDMRRLQSRVRLRLSERQFQKQGYAPLEGYDVTQHYGDQAVDASFRYVQEGFIAARIRFIRDMLGPEEIERSTFADIGDSNGVFLRALGKKGTSVNVSRDVLNNISGLETLLGGLPTIPLGDGAFDYVLCFETVEHLHDPIGGLRELARLARKGVFVSIPFVRRTRIHPYWPDRSRPATEQHVLECADGDLRKLLTYAGLRVASMRVHMVFDFPRRLDEILASLAWRAVDRELLCGAFRRFSMYFLTHGVPAPLAKPRGTLQASVRAE